MTPLETVLSRLPGHRKQGAGWAAWCPAHEDRNDRSLSVTEADDGRALLHCFGGCATESVLGRIGLTLQDLFPREGDHRRTKVIIPGGWASSGSREHLRDNSALAASARRRLSEGASSADYPASYGVARLGEGTSEDALLVPVHDPGTGSLVNVKTRFLAPRDPQVKSLSMARHPVGIIGLEVLRERPEAPVLLCEGEKDCLALARRCPEFAVVTFSGGATTFPEGGEAPLRGRRVVVLYDADDAGRIGAALVRERVAAVVAAVAVVDFRAAPGGLITGAKDRKDPSDYFEAGGSPEALEEWLLAQIDAAPKPGVPVIVRRFSELTAEPVEWLWEGWIPYGTITLIDGDPGLGKSTLSADLAARLTAGRTMADGSGGGEPGSVLIVSFEDDPNRTILPRLSAAGADTKRVVTMALRSDPEDDEGRLPMVPGDLKEVEAVIRDHGVRLVIVDPFVASLDADTNANRDQEVRRALAKLAAVARRARCAVVLIRHLNKNREGAALYRGGGSIGIAGAARSVLLVAKDPEDDDRRVLARVKCNLAPPVDSRTFRLCQAEGKSREYLGIVWEGTSPLGADALVACSLKSEEERGALGEAMQFLRGILANGAVPSKVVKREAREAGISPSTLRRAKDRLTVKAIKADFAAGWVWSLLEGEGAQPVPKEITPAERSPSTRNDSEAPQVPSEIVALEFAPDATSDDRDRLADLSPPLFDRGADPSEDPDAEGPARGPKGER